MATTKRKPSIIELNDEDEDLKFVRPRVSIKMINGASPYYGIDQSVLTRVGNVIVGGDYTGGTRGEYAIDFQILRAAVTQVASGLNSIAIGNQLTASGWNAICFGYQSQATAESSVALGVASIASGKHSLAIGDQANAINDYAISLGYLARAQDVGISVGSGSDSRNDGVAIGNTAIAAIRGVAIGASANAGTDEIVFRGLHVYVQTDAVGTREELFRLSQSASITTLGTIVSGVWHGTIIESAYGGTGINNGGRTITLNTSSAAFTFNGAYTLTIPATGTVALLATSNIFSVAQTIQAGLNLGSASGAGTGAVAMSGKIATYNNIATVQNGLAALLAEYNSGALTAAIGSTALFTPPASNGGIYRLSWFAIITRAATTSSTLGALALTYTDATTGAASTMTCGGFLGAGATGTTNTGNALDGKIYGTAILNLAASNALNFTFGYLSSGATTMQYSLFLRLERIG